MKFLLGLVVGALIGYSAHYTTVTMSISDTNATQYVKDLAKEYIK